MLGGVGAESSANAPCGDGTERHCPTGPPIYQKIGNFAVDETEHKNHKNASAILKLRTHRRQPVEAPARDVPFVKIWGVV
jgi:hypothetical protein